VITEFFANFVTIIAASVVVLLISHRLHGSSIVGLLLTGMLIGPSGLHLIQQDEVDLFAEIGVVILLFTLGLEFSLLRLRQNWRPFLIGGGLQVVCTVAVGAGLASAFHLPVRNAFFLGCLAALSSTAIVLKAYADRRELEAPQGTLTAGILLFQDFCLAPMIILAPLLAGGASASALGVLARLGAGVLLVGLVFVVARFVMPHLLHWIVRTRVREIFLLGALGACLGMALLTARFGFSLALGAFLAGLVISESEYSHQVIAEVLPFRDLFNSLFFISVGMLLQLGDLRQHLGQVLGLGAGIVVLKTVIAALVVVFMSYPLRVALVTGMSLAQVGEFSFVLGGVGLQLGLLDHSLYQTVLGASIFTMLLTPFLIQAAPHVAEWAAGLVARAPVPAGSSAGRRGIRWLRVDARGPEVPGAEPLRAHVILVGYGLNGRNVARVLRETSIPFRILELNGTLVHEARADGQPVTYGDATRPEILEACGIRDASMLVLAISDLSATRQAVRVARQRNPGIYILARTRTVSEIDELYHLGADEVIPEEFETSVEIFSRVLERYHVPRNIIQAQVRIVRGEGYGVLRGASLSTESALDRIAEILEATLTDTFLVKRGSPGEGQSLLDLDLRRRTGVTVIAVVRAGNPMTNPSPEMSLETNDTLVLVGNHAALEAAFAVLQGQAREGAPPDPGGPKISTKGESNAKVP
jgi:CPA2 family monovalent cation:H+ antiporter-2